MVTINECILDGNAGNVLLPDSVQSLLIYRCTVCFDSLWTVLPSLHGTTELKRCDIVMSTGSPFIWSPILLSHDESAESAGCSTASAPFHSDLPDFRQLVNPRSLPPPPGTLSNLKRLAIIRCPKVKKLFTLTLLQKQILRNLQEIAVKNCYNVEEMIADAVINEEDDEQLGDGRNENSSRFNSGQAIALPNLRTLILHRLPKLREIYWAVILCDSIETISIYDCPELKRIPLLLPKLGNGQLSPPPYLQLIYAEQRDWWEKLELDDPCARGILEPFVQSYHSQ
ncbi:hypothetical protein Ancab_029358 [Ancistrocladus abbreviatus]